jgi:hypothetical protein
LNSAKQRLLRCQIRINTLVPSEHAPDQLPMLNGFDRERRIMIPKKPAFLE